MPSGKPDLQTTEDIPGRHVENANNMPNETSQHTQPKVNSQSKGQRVNIGTSPPLNEEGDHTTSQSNPNRPETRPVEMYGHDLNPEPTESVHISKTSTRDPNDRDSPDLIKKVSDSPRPSARNPFSTIKGMQFRVKELPESKLRDEIHNPTTNLSNQTTAGSPTTKSPSAESATTSSRKSESSIRAPSSIEVQKSNLAILVPPSAPKEGQGRPFSYLRKSWESIRDALFTEVKRARRHMFSSQQPKSPESPWSPSKEPSLVEIHLRSRYFGFIYIWYGFVLLLYLFYRLSKLIGKFILYQIPSAIWYFLRNYVWKYIVLFTLVPTAKLFWSWVVLNHFWPLLWSWLQPIIMPIFRFVRDHPRVFVALSFGTLIATIYRTMDENTPFLHCDPCQDTSFGLYGYQPLRYVGNSFQPMSYVSFPLSLFFCPLSWKFRVVARRNSEYFDQLLYINHKIATPIMQYDYIQDLTLDAKKASAIFKKSRGGFQYSRDRTNAIKALETELLYFQAFMKSFLKYRKQALDEMSHNLPKLRGQMEFVDSFRHESWSTKYQEHKKLPPSFRERLDESYNITWEFSSLSKEGRRHIARIQTFLNLNEHLKHIPNKETPRFQKLFTEITGASIKQADNFKSIMRKWNYQHFSAELFHFQQTLEEIHNELKKSLRGQELARTRDVTLQSRCDTDLRWRIRDLEELEELIALQSRNMRVALKTVGEDE